MPDAELSPVVCYDGTAALSPTKDATVVAQIVEPYFQRTWEHFCGHNQTPPATPTGKAPFTVTSRGAAFGFDLFSAYGTHAQTHVRRATAFALARLLPHPLVKAHLPTHVEVTVTGQGSRTILHVISYAPQRLTPTLDLVESATPLIDCSVSVRLPQAPKKVTAVTSGAALACGYADGYATVRVNERDGHAVIAFE